VAVTLCLRTKSSTNGSEENAGFTQLLTRVHRQSGNVGAGGVEPEAGTSELGGSANRSGKRPTTCGPYRESSEAKNVGPKDHVVDSLVRLSRSAQTLSAVGIHAASNVTPSR